jgi:hypothetical protein
MQSVEGPVVFLKYHPLSFLDSLQKGFLYCNPIQKFSELDPADGRGDPLEYLTKIEKGPNTKIDLGYGDTHVKIIRQQDGSYISEHSNNDLFANLFCLYSIKKNLSNPAQDVLVSDELRAMVTHVLVINRPEEFINRVIKVMTSLNKKIRNSLCRLY